MKEEALYLFWNKLLVEISQAIKGTSLAPRERLAIAHRMFEQLGGTEENWKDFCDYCRNRKNLKKERSYWDKPYFSYHQVTSPGHNFSLGSPENPFLKRKDWKKAVDKTPPISHISLPEEKPAVMEHQMELEGMLPRATRYYPKGASTLIYLKDYVEVSQGLVPAEALGKVLDNRMISGGMKNRHIAKVETLRRKRKQIEERKKKRLRIGKIGKIRGAGEFMAKKALEARLARLEKYKREEIEKINEKA